MLKKVSTAAAVAFLCLMLAGTGWAAGGFVIVTGDDADDSNHCQGTLCGSLFINLLKEGITRSQSGRRGILAIGVNSGYALTALNGWNAAGSRVALTHVRTISQIENVDFSDYAMIYIPSFYLHTSGGITQTQINALNLRQADIADFVNNQGGSLIALTQAEVPGGWGFLPVTLTTRSASFTNATVTPEMTQFSPTTTSSNLSHCCFHNVFTGPPGYSGLKVLATNSSGEPAYLGGLGIILTAEVCDDGIDNDGDDLVDNDDPDCHVCSDGDLDPGEQCDDGNNVDGDGCSATCQFENQPPVAQCQDVTVYADTSSCQAGADINNGSYDPDGDTFTLSYTPAGQYSLGTTDVTLTVTDSSGATDSCTAVVTVIDDAKSIIECNSPTSITPPDTPISFTATASDSCSAITAQITSYDCYAINGSGKKVDKTESCVVRVSGDTITIIDSGGVGDHITWVVEATDSSNTSTTTCEVVVKNPGKGKGKK